MPFPPAPVCGFLGFPLAQVAFSQVGQQLTRQLNLVERFQSASVSAYGPRIQLPSGHLNLYETDGLMYGGSSGCPAFLANGRVFAMQMATIMQMGAPQSGQPATTTQLAISLSVPAADIVAFARGAGVPV